jgi:hypothetical protein
MEDFLHDYGALIAPTAAIINGFIAVLVAQFFKDHPVAKCLLVIAAAILGTAAIGATFYTQHQIVADRAAEKDRQRQIREQLGQFIAEGIGLMSDCADNSKAPRLAETEDWYSRVIKFLEERLGHSYVVRLQNQSGVPPLNMDRGR